MKYQTLADPEERKEFLESWELAGKEGNSLKVLSKFQKALVHNERTEIGATENFHTRIYFSYTQRRVT